MLCIFPLNVWLFGAKFLNMWTIYTAYLFILETARSGISALKDNLEYIPQSNFKEDVKEINLSIEEGEQ